MRRILIVLAIAMVLFPVEIFSAEVDVAVGKKIYKMNCSQCHGEKGEGGGVGASLLPVKPADHSNGIVMNNRSDDYLSKIIAKAALPWGGRPLCQPGTVYSAISKSVTSSPIFEANPGLCQSSKGADR